GAKSREQREGSKEQGAGSKEQGGGGIGVSGLSPVDMVSVFPVGEEPWEAESSGLHWELAKVQWRRGISSLSNRISEEFFLAKKSVHIKAVEGAFLVTIPLGTEVKIY
ncbi:MAG: hypothetical protein LBU99_05165, partial [Spirochaetaceae bacterium]|nr:hypothetical protein [Spirochaetaceae bacterium]